MCCFCRCWKTTSDEDIPAKITTKKYRRPSRYSKSICANETCMICLDDFVNNEDIKVARCNHGYHKNCLEHWLTVKSICPMCQHQLFDQSEHTPLLRTYTIDI